MRASISASPGFIGQQAYRLALQWSHHRLFLLQRKCNGHPVSLAVALCLNKFEARNVYPYTPRISLTTAVRCAILRFGTGVSQYVRQHPTAFELEDVSYT